MSGVGKQPNTPKPAPGPWSQYANCIGLPSDLFFTSKTESRTTSHSAKLVCAACIVRADCLEYALTTPVERFGIWGGTSERDRWRMRRQQTLAERNPVVRRSVS